MQSGLRAVLGPSCFWGLAFGRFFVGGACGCEHWALGDLAKEQVVAVHPEPQDDSRAFSTSSSLQQHYED